MSIVLFRGDTSEHLRKVQVMGPRAKKTGQKNRKSGNSSTLSKCRSRSDVHLDSVPHYNLYYGFVFSFLYSWKLSRRMERQAAMHRQREEEAPIQRSIAYFNSGLHSSLLSLASHFRDVYRQLEEEANMHRPRQEESLLNDHLDWSWHYTPMFNSKYPWNHMLLDDVEEEAAMKRQMEEIAAMIAPDRAYLEDCYMHAAHPCYLPVSDILPPVASEYYFRPREASVVKFRASFMQNRETVEREPRCHSQGKIETVELNIQPNCQHDLIRSRDKDAELPQHHIGQEQFSKWKQRAGKSKEWRQGLFVKTGKGSIKVDGRHVYLTETTNVHLESEPYLLHSRGLLKFSRRAAQTISVPLHRPKAWRALSIRGLRKRSAMSFIQKDDVDTSSATVKEGTSQGDRMQNFNHYSVKTVDQDGPVIFQYGRCIRRISLTWKGSWSPSTAHSADEVPHQIWQHATVALTTGPNHRQYACEFPPLRPLYSDMLRADLGGPQDHSLSPAGRPAMGSSVKGIIIPGKEDGSEDSMQAQPPLEHDHHTSGIVSDRAELVLQLELRKESHRRERSQWISQVLALQDFINSGFDARRKKERDSNIKEGDLIKRKHLQSPKQTATASQRQQPQRVEKKRTKSQIEAKRLRQWKRRVKGRTENSSLKGES